jgi:hypothetical protein
MADKERKPRARKKNAAPADVASVAGSGDGDAEDANALSLTSTPTADGAPGGSDDAGSSATPSRTTIDHLHESMRQHPHTYGEVF